MALRNCLECGQKISDKAKNCPKCGWKVITENSVDFYGNKKNLKFIDIGTGNGILPELISKYCKCKISHGIDPYEDGEHTTSWPTGTRKKLIDRISFFLSQKNLDIAKYKKYLGFKRLT